jgi:uncharacterized protein YceK
MNFGTFTFGKLPYMALAFSAVIALSGCSQVLALSVSSPTPTPTPIPTAVLETQTTQSKLTGSLAQQTVAALQAICTGLQTPASLARNAPPYEMYLGGGDGGTPVVLITPGLPRAAVSVSPSNRDITNTVLYYSGCKTITTNPDIPVTQPAPVTIAVFALPNFGGSTQAQVQQWMIQTTGGTVRVAIHYPITDESGACMDLGYGRVTGQSPGPGSRIAFSRTPTADAPPTVTIEVDCDRRHVVG